MGCFSLTLKRAVSYQLSAISYQLSALRFAFQTFLTTRRITCRVDAGGSKTARKILMHL